MNVRGMQRIDYWVGIPLCALLSVWAFVARLVPRGAARDGRRILFVELSEMGSTILAHSALVRARELAAPGELYFLIFAKNAPSVELLGVLPRDHVVTIDDRSFPVFVRSTVAALRRIRALGIDTVVDLELFSRFTALVSWLTGAATRVGFHNYTSEGLYRGALLTHRVLYNQHQHMTLNFLGLVEALEAPPGEVPLVKRDLRPLVLPPPLDRVDDEARRAVLARLREARPEIGPHMPLVVLSPDPGPAIPLRGWAVERYAALARELLVRLPAVVIVVMGLPESAPMAHAIVAAAASDRCIDFTGKTHSLRDVVALLDLGRVLVTSDGGPAHMASLTAIRCIVLFGPETPKLYAPLGPNVTSLYAHLSCSPCLAAANHRRTVCTDNRCMQAIGVPEVLDAVLEGLGATGVAGARSA
jgi:ADP-heptose:LPS heptosyltransferase